MPAVSSARHPPPSVKSEAVSATPLIGATVSSGRSRASAIGIGCTGSGVDAGVTDGASDGLGVRDGLELGDRVGVATGVGLAEALGISDGLAEGVADGLGESDGAGVRLGEGSSLGVAEGEGEPLGVADIEGEGEAIGVAAAFCGSGAARVTKSPMLSLVSCPDPAEPPGNRSRLDPAGGAGAGVPSSQVLVAVPHPTASIAVAAPWMRSATLPPLAANPFA
jgi:hypothetical protein